MHSHNKLRSKIQPVVKQKVVVVVDDDSHRGNESGKVSIAHGSVEFCKATPIGLADES